MTAAQILPLLQLAAGHHAWLISVLGTLVLLTRLAVWAYTKVSDQQHRTRYAQNITSEEGSLRAMQIEAQRERDRRRWLALPRRRRDEGSQSEPPG